MDAKRASQFKANACGKPKFAWLRFYHSHSGVTVVALPMRILEHAHILTH